MLSSQKKHISPVSSETLYKSQHLVTENSQGEGAPVELHFSGLLF